MLNLKKGLAVVLAAATALTFAPVSTLGLQGVVEAQAAGETTNLKNIVNEPVAVAAGIKGYVVASASLEVGHTYKAEFTHQSDATIYYRNTSKTNVFADQNWQQFSASIVVNGTTHEAGTYEFAIADLTQDDDGAYTITDGDNITLTDYDWTSTKEGLALAAKSVKFDSSASVLTTGTAVADSTDGYKFDKTYSFLADHVYSIDGEEKNQIDYLATKPANATASVGTTKLATTDTLVEDDGTVTPGTTAAPAKYILEPSTDSANLQLYAKALVAPSTNGYKVSITDLGKYTQTEAQVEASTGKDKPVSGTGLRVNRQDQTQKGDSSFKYVNEFTIPETAYASSTEKGDTFAADSNKVGYDSIVRFDDGTGFFIKGLRIQAEKDHRYAFLNSGSGLRFFKESGKASDGSVYTDDNVTRDTTRNADDTAWKNYADVAEIKDGEFYNTLQKDVAEENNLDTDVLTVDVLVTTTGHHNFNIADYVYTGQAVKTNQTIPFDVYAPLDKKKIPDFDIKKIDGEISYDSAKASTNAHTAFVLGQSTWNNQNKIFKLKLNDNNLGYAITGLTGNGDKTSITTWTGVTLENATVTVPWQNDKDHNEVEPTRHLQHNDIDLTCTALGKNNVKTNEAYDWYNVNKNTGERNTVDKDADGNYITKSATPDYGYVLPIKATGVTAGQLPITLSVKAGSVSFDVKYNFTIDKSDAAIDYIVYQDAFGRQFTNSGAGTAVLNDDKDFENRQGAAVGTRTDKQNTFVGGGKNSNDSYVVTGLNAQINNNGKFIVKSESNDVTWKSSDPTIVSVDQDGSFKVNAVGDATLYAYVGNTANNNAIVAKIQANVEEWATDYITASFTSGYDPDSSKTNLDIQSQTAANAQKSDNLAIKVYSGRTASVSSSDASKASVSDITATSAKVSSTNNAGYTTITISTPDDLKNKIRSYSTTVTVNTWALAPADFTTTPITLNTSDVAYLKDHIQVRTPANGQVTWNVYGSDPLYTLTNDGKSQNASLNNQTTSRITAGTKVGAGYVLATVLGSANTRPTSTLIPVTVLNKDLTNVISVAEGSKSFTLEEGATAQINATAKSGVVTFASKDSSVATVTTGGALTAVKAGETVITASAEGAQSVEIPVVVKSKNADTESIKVPGKVSKIVVRNVKGAKAKISYSQLKDVAGYKVVYKYKDKNGKQVRKTFVNNAGKGSKTVNVPKNTSVKVWVRAFRLNKDNQRVNGAYKTKTFKTDNK